MTTSNHSSKPSKEGVKSTVLAGGIGALIVIGAQAITPPNALSKWLEISAPALAIGIEKLFKRLFVWMYIKQLKKQAKSASNEIEEYLQNPNTSEEHKNNLRRKLEQMQNTSIELATVGILNHPPAEKIIEDQLTNHQ
jgi:GTPase SAR1 family protein